MLHRDNLFDKQSIYDEGIRVENTVDYMIIFIPNEQIFAFISEADRQIWDEALKSQVVLCSPLTLFAVLSIIRQSVDNFYIEERATQILAVLSDFQKQWEQFVGSFDGLGNKLEAAQKEFEKLAGARRNSLDKQLARIEALRQNKIKEVDSGNSNSDGFKPEKSSILYEIRED